MQRFWKQTPLGVAAIILATMALSAAPVGAYCNLDPCNEGETRVCSMCTYTREFDGGHCRYILIFCVDCRSGDFFYAEEIEDYCLYQPF